MITTFGRLIDAVIVTAMESEAQPFLDRATEIGEQRRFGNATHQAITVDGKSVLLVRAGIGLVNAAGATTSAILAIREQGAERRPVIISAGTAGGIGEEVRVGDVIVGAQYINVDADARAFGYVLGQVPQMPASYAAPDSVVDAATSSKAERSLDARGGSVRVGLIVSSYSFVTPDRAASIRSDFPATLATDMESVAIAQTAHVWGHLFVSVRGISDLCGPAADSDFLTHVDDAADRSADVVLELLAQL
jgi:adenosylhomocysteine nucleosidase